MDYKYEDIIEAINSYSISEIDFKVNNYAHYNNCKIIVRRDLLPNENSIFLIDIFLTKDESEHICFYGYFKEDFKLFHMGKRGSFTLKQLWENIEILDIIYI